MVAAMLKAVNGTKVALPLWLVQSILGIVLTILTLWVGTISAKITDLDQGQAELQIGQGKLEANIESVKEKLESNSSRLVRMEDYMLRALHVEVPNYPQPPPSPPSTHK
jgi:hypothetical protein